MTKPKILLNLPHPLRRLLSLAAVLIVVGSTAPLAQQPPPPPPNEAPPPGAQRSGADVVPPRLSFTQGDVSFWRPGSDNWTVAQTNTPLAPGDNLYAGDGANLELQIGSRAFVRGAAATQLALDNLEPDFMQMRVTGGSASLDLRSIRAGQTLELDTPNAAFSIEATGYYRVNVGQDETTFIARRGGHALVTPAGGEASTIAPSEEVVIQGGDPPTLEAYAAPELDPWDRWNYDRTDHLIDSVSARYVPSGIYGADTLDHYGNWRVTGEYGPVWVPQGVDPGWAPYSTGDWIWDPYYGWTWVDRAPWGWAPYHYGRWVHVSEQWCWAPGPMVAAPVYAPALVAFFGGEHFGVSIGIGGPAVGWVSLGWGEPVVPWWGRPGFIGVPSWRGWGGPHVVNNTVIERNTVVNVTNINVYQNARVHDAVVAVQQDRFGRGAADHVRVREVDPQKLEPLHGRLPVQPVAASLSPRTESARRPPEALERRPVVATRNPRDVAAPLRSEGLKVADRPEAAPRIVNAPKSPRSAFSSPRVPYGQRGGEERPLPAAPPQFGAGPPSRGQPAQRPAPQPRSMQQPPERQAPALQAPGPRQVAPPPPQRDERVAPHEAAPARPQAAPPPHEAPPAPQPRRQPEVAPRAEPVPQSERREMARPQPAPRSLPGEPANRMYRPAPAPQKAPHAIQGAPRPTGGDRRDSRKHHE